MQPVKIHQHDVIVNAGHHWTVAHNIKTVVAWIFSVVGIAVAVAWVYTSLCQTYSSLLLKYFFVLLFLAAGISHIFIFPKWLSHRYNTGRFIYMLLVATCTSIAVYLVFTAASFNGGMLPYAAGAAFLLPFAVKMCWQYYAAISQVHPYKEWYVPEVQPESKLSLLLLNSMPFKIKIKMKEADTEAIIFAMSLTGKLDVGRMFCRFLYDRHGEIEVTGENGYVYPWLFFVKKWYGVKALDPCKSLIKNGIKENDMVIIERGQNTAA